MCLLHVLFVVLSVAVTLLKTQPINYAAGEILRDGFAFPSMDIEGPKDQPQDIQFLSMRIPPFGLIETKGWKSPSSGYVDFSGTDEDDDTFSEEDSSDVFDANEDFYLNQLSSYLFDLLREPKSPAMSLIFVENYPQRRAFIDDMKFANNAAGISVLRKKKSRYHRKGGKRQNSRSRNNYNSSRYLCVPTREDILQLLIALHDVRQGDKSRTVEFCNRRRSASGIFTNIRFLGRRRK